MGHPAAVQISPLSDERRLAAATAAALRMSSTTPRMSAATALAVGLGWDGLGCGPVLWLRLRAVLLFRDRPHLLLRSRAVLRLRH